MALLEVLNQFSAFIAIWLAIYGIDSWRREHTAKRQIELAEETLALFYEAADAIKYMRNPASYSSETEDVVKAENESDAGYRARKQASIIFKRYRDNKELFSKLHAMRYRFMAQIGKEPAKPFDDLRGVVNEIQSSASMLSRLWTRDDFQTPAKQEGHQKQISKYEAVFWEGLAESDPINPKLDELTRRMEKTCQEIIGGKGTVYSILNKRFGGRG
ncbi:MAG: hypothetical protein ABIT23_02295 [Nitrosospira sp.]